MTGPRFPQVNIDCLCLVNIEDQVVDLAPVHQAFHLVPVGQFVTLGEAHNSWVISKLQEVVGWVIRVKSRGLRTQP